jgi:hypothetical protein
MLLLKQKEVGTVAGKTEGYVSNMAQRQSQWPSAQKADRTSLKKLFNDYKGGEEMPLAGYAGLLGVFSVALAGVLLAARGADDSTHTKAPQASLGDLLLMGVATHKLSRLISKDRVTSPLRAPFTEYEGPASASDVKEQSRGTGLQRALGDLITCPYCMGPWVATALVYGFSKRPRLTRLVAGIFTVTAMSDFLHHTLGAVQKLEE